MSEDWAKFLAAMVGVFVSGVGVLMLVVGVVFILRSMGIEVPQK